MFAFLFYWWPENRYRSVLVTQAKHVKIIPEAHDKLVYYLNSLMNNRNVHFSTDF